ncbi:hypothetical protein MVES_001007 [Malassezia vespertilionis]|uniref:Uncharacterized protein n=2 Tax=Malassezia vespertilionis TaxID=2020962 RepID=A0A2N1JET7_9BASI|nr:hypothetical protein MVES_001007 [Malassezia vespertilionis]
MSPPEPHARVQPRMPASRTFTRGNASDWLNRIASSPQLGSPQRAGATTDLHNYPPPEVLRYERQAACLQSPVKRPRIHAAFHEPPAFCFPAHGASGSSPQLRLPNGHVASSLAQDLGLCEGSPHVRHRGPVHSHARNASLSSLSDARHETGLVPIPNTPDTLRTAHDTRPWHSRNWSMDSVPLRPLHAPPRRRLAPPPQSLPAPRHAYLDNSALSSRSWGRETISRAHRRSVSHSMVETMTPVPVSRDRSGLITTPPGALTSPVYPDTPKTMGCHFPSGEFLNTSPTPQPRQRAPKGARPQRATLAAKPGHARVQSDDLRS